MELSLATLLVRPRAAFEADEEPLSLTQPATLVFLVSVASIAMTFPLYVEFGARLPSDIATVELVIGGRTATLPVAFAVGIAVGLVLAVLFWLLLTALLYGAGRLLGGSAGFRQTLAVTGWAHAPYAVVLPIILGTAVVLAATTPETTVRQVLHGPAGLAADPMPTFNGQGLMDARSVPSYLQTLWVGYLWFGGLLAVHDLSRRRAAVGAGLTTLVSILVFQSPV